MKVSYVVETKKGFRPFVAQVVPDDDDSSLYVIASGTISKKLDESQDFIDNNKKGIDKTYLNPIKASSMGVSWLSELENANPE